MRDQIDTRQLTSQLRWIPQAASAGAVVVGGLVLVGWWLDVATLKSPMLGFHAIKANTALAFVLIGLSLWWSQAEFTSRWKRGVSQVCAAIVALVGLLTLSEYLFGWDVGIDQLMAKDLQEITEPYHVSGRMAFVSGLNFLLLGSALLLLEVETRRSYQYAPVLAVVAAASAVLSLVAYLYGGAAVHQVYPRETVAPHTALLFLVLAVGILFARSQHGIVSFVMSDTAAASAARRLMLIVIVLSVFLGWMRLMGERLNLFGTEFGLALIVVFGILGLTGSIYWQAKSLMRAELYQRGINEMSAVLGRSLQLEEIYPAFAEAVKAVLPYHRISVVVPDGESLVAVLSVAESPLQAYQRKVWRRRSDTAVEWVIAHKTPRLIRDLTREQGFADEAFVAQEGVRATLILPLVAGGETVGVFVIDSRTPGVYSEGHEDLVGLIGKQLALAIQNANLYAQVKRHAVELQQQVDERTQQLQEATRRAEEASRHKSVFLANMSHELRTPLNAILGFSDLLRDQAFGSLSAKQARYAHHIHTSGRHLLTLINDLLDLSKVEAGKLTLRPEPFALSEALTAALQEIHPLADPKRLTLTLDTDTVPAVLTADPIRFKQIVYNLLSNAVKFTPEDGRITVTVRIVSDAGHQEAGGGCEFVEIAVTDTGIGIAAEDLPKLFGRFSQLETTKQSQGSGLGLALTRQLVELHGGTITAASAGPSQGSRFTVRLPMAPAASSEPRAR
ncbi:MAG: GAF domain-containing protein [candidate division NC10 bacterium]|nr:GAF domain-containing protein [candidate division NC10 bacterium]MDE2320649.1 GAF domain-containing protein [candidate division NC10 bacterium]